MISELWELCAAHVLRVSSRDWHQQAKGDNATSIVNSNTTMATPSVTTNITPTLLPPPPHHNHFCHDEDRHHRRCHPTTKHADRSRGKCFTVLARVSAVDGAVHPAFFYGIQIADRAPSHTLPKQEHPHNKRNPKTRTQ